MASSYSSTNISMSRCRLPRLPSSFRTTRNKSSKSSTKSWALPILRAWMTKYNTTILSDRSQQSSASCFTFSRCRRRSDGLSTTLASLQTRSTSSHSDRSRRCFLRLSERMSSSKEWTPWSAASISIIQRRVERILAAS